MIDWKDWSLRVTFGAVVLLVVSDLVRPTPAVYWPLRMLIYLLVVASGGITVRRFQAHDPEVSGAQVVVDAVLIVVAICLLLRDDIRIVLPRDGARLF